MRGAREFIGVMPGIAKWSSFKPAALSSSIKLTSECPAFRLAATCLTTALSCDFVAGRRAMLFPSSACCVDLMRDLRRQFLPPFSAQSAISAGNLARELAARGCCGWRAREIAHYSKSFLQCFLWRIAWKHLRVDVSTWRIAPVTLARFALHVLPER